jgi:phage/plasmid-associated DNA primase
VLLYGPPRSGKSTLLQLANLIAGNEAAANAGPELFDRETEGLRSRGIWNGRRLVTLEELPAEALRSEELVKAMTAHGGVAQRRLHQHEELSNRWTPKLLMATNDPPRYSDRSGALTERLLYVRCPNHRPENQRDIHLLDRLSAELAGFAVHCLAEAQAVLAAGRYPESQAARALRAEIETSGDPIKMFVYEACVLEAGTYTATDTLYATYREHCEKNGHRYPMAKIHFARALLERYREFKDERRYVHGDRKRCILGIRFREGSDPDPDDGTAGTVQDSTPASSVPSNAAHQDAENGDNWTDGTVTSQNYQNTGEGGVNNRENRETTVLTVPLAPVESRSSPLGRAEPAWDSNGTLTVPQTPAQLPLAERVRAGTERKRLADEYEQLTGAIPPGAPTVEWLRAEVERLRLEGSPA